MKVYLVIRAWIDEGYVNAITDYSVYGVYSNIRKAMIVRHNIMKSVEKHNENENVSVMILNLDEETDIYNFMMSTD